MNYEQKYNEVLQKAKEEYNRLGELENESMKRRFEIIFPELAESEDERIRTRLSEYFRGFLEGNEHCYKYGGYVKWEGLDVKSILDWLEKQKEQKPVKKEITLTNFEEVLNTFLFDFANSPIEDCEPKEYTKKHYAEILKAAYTELNAQLKQDIFEAQQEGRREGYEAAKAEQKPEWSEEDEKMVQFWNMYYEHKVGDWSNKDVVEHLERFREWLNTRFKSLRPRQDAGWNKEDEEYLSQAIETLEHENYTLIAENLKSLRPRWKPSKEHPVEWKDEYREEDLRTRFAFYTYKNEEDDSVLYLSNVFVEEASRNAGFGTKILEAAEKVAETIGAITIRLKVKQDSPANAWYRKRGYGYIAFEGEYDWLEKNLEYLKPKRNKKERVEGLEEEIKSYFNGWCNDDEYGQAVMPDCCCASVDDCKDIARHFYELGCCRTAVMYDEIEYNRQRAEEAENEEFEKELHQYWLEQKREGVIVDGSIDDYITIQEVARHFAEWGAEHLKK